jgi:hypothetical protein
MVKKSIYWGSSMAKIVFLFIRGGKLRKLAGIAGDASGDKWEVGSGRKKMGDMGKMGMMWWAVGGAKVKVKIR